MATALLITDEDCRAEDFPLAGLDIRAAAVLRSSHLRSPLPVAEKVEAFETGALADAAARAGVAAVVLRADDPAGLAQWAAGAGVAQIATPFVTRGPLQDWMAEAGSHLAARGITLTEWRRDWDLAIWPHATAGFFKVRQQIPQILDRIAQAG